MVGVVWWLPCQQAAADLGISSVQVRALPCLALAGSFVRCWALIWCFHVSWCRSLYINLVGLWAILVCATLCGLALYSIYKDCDPWTAKQVLALDQVQPHISEEGSGRVSFLCSHNKQTKAVQESGAWKQWHDGILCQAETTVPGAASPSALGKVGSRESCNVESSQYTHLCKRVGF